MKIRVKLNGVWQTLETSLNERVISLLRRIGIKSVKQGCDFEGTCGACAIILDGKLVNSCQLIAGQIEGREILTVEGLSSPHNLHPIQKAFIDSGVVQCGYCTPSMILATWELFQNNKEPSKEDIKDIFSGIYCRCTGYEQLYDAISLAKKYINGKFNNDKIFPTFREDLRFVGKSTPKVDGIRLVRGEPSFVADIVKPETLYLKVLRSPYPSAKIKKIDTEEALKLDGVFYILTHENAPKTFYNTAGQGFPEPSPYDRRLIDDRVRFVGDRVAVVAAISPEIAKEALSKIKVEYEVLKPVLSIEEASAKDAPIVHERDTSIDPLHIGADPSKNIAAFNEGGIGDIEKGFKEADVVIEREYRTSKVQASPLETHICHTYLENGRLIIHASTQVPWHLRRIVAKVLGINENLIRVIKERVGGGFGVKQDIVLEDIASWITWHTGKPVFFAFTREEEFIASRIRHQMIIKVKMGAKKDGTLTAIDMNLLADTGAYGPHCLTVPMNACSKSLPILRCKNVHYSVTSYYTNNPISGAYMGYGAPQGTFAIQMASAELAKELGMDITQFLDKNHVRAGDKLEILKCLGEGQEGIPQVVTSCGLEECLKRGKELIEWGKKSETKSPFIKSGKGVALVQQGSGLPGIDSSNASIKMLADGGFLVLLGGTDLGTGLDTVAVKIASEILCIDYKKVSVISSDTDVTPFDVGAYASSGTYFSGMAVYKAAMEMKEKILESASKILNIDKDKLRLEYPEIVTDGEKRIKFSEIAHKTQGGKGEGELISFGSFTTEEAPIPYGVHFAEVEVDIETGKVNLKKYIALQDCGTPINPDLALGQIYGGSIKAIGHSLYEEMKFDSSGRCLNPNFTDYKVPMIKDAPEEFKAYLVYVEEKLGPFGAKSVSEISTNGAAPAIANAIYDAVGVWLREWPFTPEKILNAIKKQ